MPLALTTADGSVGKVCGRGHPERNADVSISTEDIRCLSSGLRQDSLWIPFM